MTFAGTIETIVVERPPGRDNFGDPLPDAPLFFEVPNCLWAPGATSENLDGANQVVADGNVYAPAGTVVYATDRVRRGARLVDGVLVEPGDVYEVAGKPQDWSNAGVVIPVRQVNG